MPNWLGCGDSMNRPLFNLTRAALEMMPRWLTLVGAMIEMARCSLKGKETTIRFNGLKWKTPILFL